MEKESLNETGNTNEYYVLSDGSIEISLDDHTKLYSPSHYLSNNDYNYLIKQKMEDYLGTGMSKEGFKAYIEFKHTKCKRFQFQWIFRTRVDHEYDELMLKLYPNYKPKPLREVPVMIYLNSKKDAEEKFPFRMLNHYDYLRFERTGKKIRSSDYKNEIYWWLFKRWINKIFKLK